MLADNLTPPDQVVALYKSRNISKLRLFNPNPTVLKALQHSGMDVALSTLNQDLQLLATDQSYASDWVATNVAPYSSTLTFRYITAGSEVNAPSPPQCLEHPTLLPRVRFRRRQAP